MPGHRQVEGNGAVSVSGDLLPVALAVKSATRLRGVCIWTTRGLQPHILPKSHKRLLSVNNKIKTLVDYILDGDYDVVALTETWVAPGDTVTGGAIAPDEYTLHQVSRASK